MCQQNEDDEEKRNCLTTEVCNSILLSVAYNVNAANQYVSHSLGRICDSVCCTNYKYLCDSINETARRYLYPVKVGGQFRNSVDTDAERELAEKLESSLSKLFKSCQPSKYFSPMYCSGLPVISSSFFYYLELDVRNYSYEAASIADGHVDANGVEKYQNIAHSLQEELGDILQFYFSEIHRTICCVQSEFEAGCSDVFSRMGNINGYTGSVPGFD